MVKIQDTVLHQTHPEMVSEGLLGIEMDLLVLWKVFIEVMNTLDHNSPSIGVTMVSPEFWIGNWIGPFEVEERVSTMKEHKNDSHVCGVSKFETPPETCIFFHRQRSLERKLLGAN